MKDAELEAAMALQMDRALGAGAFGQLADLIYRAGEEKHRALAPRILDIARAADNERLLENAAWALGKFTYVPAQPVLVRLLGYSSLRLEDCARRFMGAGRDRLGFL